ncbi:sulfotransferase family 2 domain-containing protein [uncultured Parabacteroides sp.]|uniref:sulfotransferase family 2 domain-containing protein n=1 Tax=uncultured Parabacteroides sp. TaxID=512312 RepID=UPI00259BA251|nr:sulfotransferase family 2 domain-containing protein [uncultured Parabacteroides sp.]
MIVDEKHKVIYLHNPKCGGTFLRDLYIEKYGNTEATKWWQYYTHKYGTDLGHVTYNDLPRFILEREEYRITVMVRNPYNRFYSAVKEFSQQLKNVGGVIKYPKLMVGEYTESNLLTKIYLLTIYPGIYRLRKLQRASVNDICNQIFRSSDQDFYLRNKRIPWLNPQSYFIGKNVEVFQYESESDWLKLLELFDLSEYQNRLLIARDYNIPEEVREMIEELYPEDRKLFRLY